MYKQGGEGEQQKHQQVEKQQIEKQAGDPRRSR